jgi:hypothetical protein
MLRREIAHLLSILEKAMANTGLAGGTQCGRGLLEHRRFGSLQTAWAECLHLHQQPEALPKVQSITGQLTVKLEVIGRTVRKLRSKSVRTFMAMT